MLLEAAKPLGSEFAQPSEGALLLLLGALGRAFLAPPLSGDEGGCWANVSLLSLTPPAVVWSPQCLNESPAVPQGPGMSSSQAERFPVASLVECQ